MPATINPSWRRTNLLTNPIPRYDCDPQLYVSLYEFCNIPCTLYYHPSFPIRKAHSFYSRVSVY